MAHDILKNVRIKGIVCAIPPKIKRSKEYIEQIGEEAVNKFIDTVGIEERHICDGKIMTSDLCCAAAEKLVDTLQIEKQEIDALIFVSQTPDYPSPSTACVLQYRLGLSRNCMAYDINLACSGYVYGLTAAASYLQSEKIKKVLLLSGDATTYQSSPMDRGLMMMCGDAGSATLLERSEDEKNQMMYMLQTIGSGYKSLITPYGGYKHKFGARERTEREPGVWRSDYDGYMDGADVFKFSIIEVPKLIKEFYEAFQYSSENFDKVFFHQANRFILKNIAKRIRFPWDKTPLSLEHYGNTGAASIPLTICNHYNTSSHKTEEHILLCGFGIGLSLGVVSLNIVPEVCLETFESDLTFNDEIEDLHKVKKSLINV